MKARALLLFLTLALHVQGAHVLFNFTDFGVTTTGLTNKRVTLTPRSTPRVEGSVIVTSDRLSFTTDANASFTVSNIVYGTYLVEVPGPFVVTPFTILVPQTNVLLNATGLVTQTIIPASTAGYTQAQIDALFLLSRIEAGTNIVATTNAAGIVTINATASGSGGSGGGSGSLVTLGSGSPEGTQPGTTLYYDVTAGSLWINPTGLTTGWIQLLKTGYAPFEGGIGGGGSSDVLLGSGSPEGVITANPGTLYWDLGHSFWLKQSGAGPTGWIQLLRF